VAGIDVAIFSVAIQMIQPVDLVIKHIVSQMMGVNADLDTKSGEFRHTWFRPQIT